MIIFIFLMRVLGVRAVTDSIKVTPQSANSSLVNVEAHLASTA